MNFEKKVKNIYPDAEPFTALMGWGIWVPNSFVLAIGCHETVEKAWRYAWYAAELNERKKGADYETSIHW